MDEEQQRLQEREEYRRSFFGSLFEGGFWTLLTGALVVGIFGMFLKNNEGLQNWVTETFGLQGQAFINQAFQAFGMDPVYPEANEEYLRSLETDDAVSLIRRQMGQTEVIVGDHMLDVLMKQGTNREITLALLKEEGFDFNMPEMTPDMIRSALLRALNNQTQLSGVTSEQLQTYTNQVLEALNKDIEDIRAGRQQQNVGLLTQARDWVEGLFSGETVNRSGISIAHHPALIGTVLAVAPEQALHQLVAMSDSETLKTFVAVDANKEAVLGLIQAIPADQRVELTQLLFESLGKDNVSAGAILQNTELLNMFKQHRAALEQFMNGIDPSFLPEDQRQPFTIARGILFAPSDVEGKTNFDVIADISDDPELLAEISALINRMAQQESLENIHMSEAAAGVIRNLNFDFSDVAPLVKPLIQNGASQIISENLGSNWGSMLGGIGGSIAEVMTQGWDQLPSLEGVSGGSETHEIGEGNIDRFIDKHVVQPALAR